MSRAPDTPRDVARPNVPRKDTCQHRPKQSFGAKIVGVHPFHGIKIAAGTEQSQPVRTSAKKMTAHEFTAALVVSAERIGKRVDRCAQGILDGDLATHDFRLDLLIRQEREVGVRQSMTAEYDSAPVHFLDLAPIQHRTLAHRGQAIRVGRFAVLSYGKENRRQKVVPLQNRKGLPINRLIPIIECQGEGALREWGIPPQAFHRIADAQGFIASLIQLGHSLFKKVRREGDRRTELVESMKSQYDKRVGHREFIEG